MNTRISWTTMALALCFCLASPAFAVHLDEAVYDPGELPPRASETHLKPGDPAPEFTLPIVDGGTVTLADYRGGKNVVLSFVPAAWTPVCSDQWPGYKLALEIFEQYDTVLLGITVDNRPSLHAWIEAMGGLNFPILSDFWPHGKVAQSYGVLRTDGMSERALFLIDKQALSAGWMCTTSTAARIWEFLFRN